MNVERVVFASLSVEYGGNSSVLLNKIMVACEETGALLVLNAPKSIQNAAKELYLQSRNLFPMQFFDSESDAYYYAKEESVGLSPYCSNPLPTKKGALKNEPLPITSIHHAELQSALMCDAQCLVVLCDEIDTESASQQFKNHNAYCFKNSQAKDSNYLLYSAISGGLDHLG